MMATECVSAGGNTATFLSIEQQMRAFIDHEISLNEKSPARWLGFCDFSFYFYFIEWRIIQCQLCLLGICFGMNELGRDFDVVGVDRFLCEALPGVDG